MVSVPSRGGELAIGHWEEEHAIRPGSQLVIATIQEQLVFIDAYDVTVAGRGHPPSRQHLIPLLLHDIQSKQVLAHKVVPASLDQE